VVTGFNTEDWPESFAPEGMHRVRDRELVQLRVQRRAYTFPQNPCALLPLYNQLGAPLLTANGSRIFTANWSSVASNSWFLAGPCINVSITPVPPAPSTVWPFSHRVLPR